ncbi:LOW QUALITY PROTEIN: bile acid receptor-like [Rhynchonycteris naso]
MLEECLLTKIQCKSKKLRKNFKQKNSFDSSIKEKEVGVDNKLVSSTPRSGKVIQESMELTQEEYQLINNIVTAHQKYTIPLEETKKILQKYEYPEMNFLQLSETVVLRIQGLMNFTKELPGFKNLTNEDQTALQKESETEVMFLHAAQLHKECLASASESTMRLPANSLNCYNHSGDGSAIYSMEMFCNKGCSSTTLTGTVEEFIGMLFYFYRRMSELNITYTEYALAATTVFFSDRPCLKNKQHVENLQEAILQILYKYSKIYHPEDLQHFARLIGRLTELRTLNHSHSEILSIWKTKDPKLASLLSEKWNLYSHC